MTEKQVNRQTMSNDFINLKNKRKMGLPLVPTVMSSWDISFIINKCYFLDQNHFRFLFKNLHKSYTIDVKNTLSSCSSEK